MKKLLVLSAIAFFGIMNAQTEKGSWVVGGSTTLGFNNSTSKFKSDGSSSDGPKISALTVTPSVGYFVINKLAIGLDLGYTTQTTKQDLYQFDQTYSLKTTASSFSVMPTATYYFKSNEKLLPYLGLGAGYASNKIKYSVSGASDDPSESSNGGFTWKAKGGLVYLITPSIGLDLGVSFNQVLSTEDVPNYIYTNYGEQIQSGTYEVKTTENKFGVNVGFSFFFK